MSFNVIEAEQARLSRDVYNEDTSSHTASQAIKELTKQVSENRVKEIECISKQIRETDDAELRAILLSKLETL